MISVQCGSSLARKTQCRGIFGDNDLSPVKDDLVQVPRDLAFPYSQKKILVPVILSGLEIGH